MTAQSLPKIKADVLWMLEYLHQGGSFGYWWTLEGKQSTWWPVKQPAPFSTADLGKNIYFGIHPTNAIPTTDGSGNPKPPESLRSRKELIAAVNCLFAEFDAKDFADGKPGALAHIQGLKRKPTVLIDSGGGYHCYWLLDETFYIRSEADRGFIADLQARWVEFTGGDKAAKDLARVLRVPGTLNRKYDPPRQVVFLEVDRQCIYSLDDLASLLPQPEAIEKQTYTPKRGTGADERPGDEWAATTSWEEILEPHGWHVDHTEANKIMWCRPGKPGGVSATVGFAGRDQLYVFTSNAQPLQPNTGYSKFTTYAILNHNGDFRAAAKALAEAGYGRTNGNGHHAPPEPEYPDDFPPVGMDAIYTPELAQMLDQIIDADTELPPAAALSESVDNPLLLQLPADHDGHADCVLLLYPNRIAYNDALGWMYYDGRCWQREDAEARVDQIVVTTLKARRHAAVKADKESLVNLTRANSANLNGTKALLRGKITVSPDEFDQDTDLLNCRNGTLDLKTGKLSPHDPRRRFTYALPIDYDPAADYSEWLNFLTEAVNQDQELIDYLQMAIGYSLTGDTREEILFYLYGPTRSGKGTFTETLLSMLGRPLATEADFTSFTADRFGDTQNFDLAPLKPCRFVAASESDKNRPLNPAKIKALTGGNLVRCAYKHQTHFTYRPQFKIWLSSNHPANVDVDDDAAWARVKVIEFPNSHLGAEDKTLKIRLRQPAQLNGALRWAVEGARRWYENPQGLRTPPAVKSATSKQRAAQDFIQMFLDENTETDPASWIHVGALHGIYKTWCDANGIPVKYLNQFSRALAGKGYQQARKTNADGKLVRAITGLKLRA